MSQDRRMEYLDHRRIIYRTIPQSEPTVKYPWGMYFEQGTYECYDLFRSKAKITTYKSLKWHLLVLWYLNPNLNQDDFQQLAEVLAEPENGFTTFKIPSQLLKNIIYEVSMHDLEEPPKNRLRKIIFDPMCGLSTEEKLKIVGKLAGRAKKVTDSDIYDTMLYLHDERKPITISELARFHDCSPRTIHRNMGNELKKEKELLNQEL